MLSLDADTIALIKNNNLFAGISDDQLQEILALARILTFKPKELIVREGDPAEDIFIIKSGDVEILKNEAEVAIQHRISTLHPGAIIGELALIDEAPRSASARALEATTLIALSIKDLQSLSVEHKLATNLARELSQRLKTSNESIVRSLRNELALEKTRVAMGDLLVNLITLISIYSIALSIISKITHAATSTTIIGIPIISIFAAVTYFIIKKNDYPLSFYGITLNNWRRSVVESIVFTLPFLVLIVVAKYIAIKFVPEFHNVPLLHLGSDASDVKSWQAIAIPLVYLAFIPVQELMYRGLLQGSLQQFLSGPHKIAFAILISNLVFSLTHLHVAFGLALLVFIPGLFWGWLYARHRTLIGVSLSHLLIGGWAFFVVGINFFLHVAS